MANVNAELRMVGSETTWVARGIGYELDARSRRDIALIQPQLDREAAVFRAVFSVDPAPVQLTVAHTAAPGEAPLMTPVLPAAGVPLVTVFIGGPPGERKGDPRPREDEGERARRGAEASAVRQGGPGSPFRQLVRAWLSARASTLTAHAAGSAQASGEANDPRVAAWAEDALLGLTADSARVDAVSHQLIASESLYPLAEFFTMERPPNVIRQSAEGQQRGEGERRPQGGGMGGGMGGRGGRGGMGGGGRGGMGGGMGRGGGAGGGGNRGGERRGAAMPLSGGMLFDAEALVVAQCLTKREGSAFVGRLIEAQMIGKPVTDALASAKALPTDLTQLDDYWRRWMAFRVQDSHTH